MENLDFWWYVTIKSSESEDMLMSLANVAECIGSEVQNLPNGQTRLRAYFRNNEDISYWQDKLLDAAQNMCSIEIEDAGKIENQPWHTVVKEAFPPLPVGKNLVVLAPWHKDKIDEDGKDGKKIPLFINPGSAFGTGYHESTQIALTLLEKYIKHGAKIADIGTGSGILSIAAIKMGASFSNAVDIDATVLEEVANNFELNCISKNKVCLKLGDLLKDFNETADLLMANILLNPLTTMVGSVPSVIGKTGMAIFSGMLEKEKPIFLEALENANMEVVEECVKGEWWGVATKVKA